MMMKCYEKVSLAFAFNGIDINLLRTRLFIPQGK